MLEETTGNASVELACDLAAEVLRRFGVLRLRVVGTSMVPSILPGDFVSIRRTSLDEVSAGDVVLLRRHERLIIHRAVDRKLAFAAARLEEACLITRGDRLRHNDRPVFPRQLLGRVVSVERGNRKLEVPDYPASLPLVRLLQDSDRVTSLYLRLAAFLPNLFLGRAKCPA